MVSIDLWRVRIGGWAGRSSPSAPVPERATIQLRIRVQFRMNDYVQLKASGVVQWGISTSVFAVVISILLIIGSVELNPGPVYIEFPVFHGKSCIVRSLKPYGTWFSCGIYFRSVLLGKSKCDVIFPINIYRGYS